MACEDAGRLIVVSGMVFESRLAKGPGICTCHGLEPLKLIADIERAIGQGASGILSFGTAAGLLPALSAGAIVLGRQLYWQGQTFATDAAWAARLLQQLPHAALADIAGLDRPLTGIAQKSALLAESGAAAADMESQHVALLAQRHHLPFAVLRVVLDDAQVTLPPASLAATRPDGTINYAALLASLWAHPGQLPNMLRLARDYARAKAALRGAGERLNGSRFALKAC